MATGTDKPAAGLWRLLAIEISRDEVLLRSSALAYSTLASLVPIFAIILAILSGPAFEQSREKVIDQIAATLVPATQAEEGWIVDADSPQDDLKQTFRTTVVPLAERANAVSVFGFLILVVTAGLLFRTVERAFNVIWRADRRRPVFMRLAIATALIFWGPVVLAVSVTLTEKIGVLPLATRYLLSTVFTAAAFTAFYMIMPHAQVRFVPAALGAVAAAVCWELAKWLFLVYVTRVVNYHRVYGSLGLIPMLFLWVYLNWVIVLSGAELAYCLQFRSALLQQWRAAEAKAAGNDIPVPSSLVLAAAIEIARRFRTPGAGGVRASQLADALQVEAGLAQQAARRLLEGKILARVVSPDAAADGADPAYLPACEPNRCNVSVLLAATREERITGDGPAWDRTRHLLAEAGKVHDRQFAAVTLANLADEQFKLQN